VSLSKLLSTRPNDGGGNDRVVRLLTRKDQALRPLYLIFVNINGRLCVEVSGMLGERFGHCQYGTSCPKSGDTRASGECLVEPGKVDDRHRAVRSRHSLERRVEMGAKIEPATDATKADDLDT
jgi:hypothetical protein